MISREMFESRILPRLKIELNGCWEWQGGKCYGYGKIRIHDHQYLVHRYTYIILKGEIPEGLVLDHLCRNRACCNPEHMEPVTIAENVRRGIRPPASTHCPQGHPFAGDNLMMCGDKRYCRACRSVRYEQQQSLCSRGHEYSAANTWMSPKGYRYCSTCYPQKIDVLDGAVSEHANLSM